jgi:hypothetical protein
MLVFIVSWTKQCAKSILEQLPPFRRSKPSGNCSRGANDKGNHWKGGKRVNSNHKSDDELSEAFAENLRLIEAICVINLIFVTMVSNWGTFEASDSTAREYKPLSQQLLIAFLKCLIFAAPGLESLPSHGNSRNCHIKIRLDNRQVLID